MTNLQNFHCKKYLIDKTIILYQDKDVINWTARHFATAQGRIPYRKISKISVQEYIIRNQTWCVTDYKERKTTKPNISRQEWTGFNKFKDDSKIVLSLTDKGNVTLIMDRSNYKLKILGLLQNSSYRSNRNPTTKVKNNLESLIETALFIEHNFNAD